LKTKIYVLCEYQQNSILKLFIVIER